MEDIDNWQAKFECCEYSAKLLNKLILLNDKVTYPVDIRELSKLSTMLRNTMVVKCGNPVTPQLLKVKKYKTLRWLCPKNCVNFKIGYI